MDAHTISGSAQLSNFCFAVGALLLVGCTSTPNVIGQKSTAEPMKLEFPKSKTFVFHRTELEPFLLSRMQMMTTGFPDEKVKAALIRDHMRSLNDIPESTEITLSIRDKISKVYLQRAINTLVLENPDSILRHQTEYSYRRIKPSTELYTEVEESPPGSFKVTIDYVKTWAFQATSTTYGEGIVTVKLNMERMPSNIENTTIFNVKITDIGGDDWIMHDHDVQKLGEITFDLNAFRKELARLPDIYINQMIPEPIHPDKQYVQEVILKSAKLLVDDLAQNIKAQQRQQSIEQTAGFRKVLSRGDDSHCGLVIEVQPPIAQIQTLEGPQWLKINQLYPPRMAPCKFINGVYVDYHL